MYNILAELQAQGKTNVACRNQIITLPCGVHTMKGHQKKIKYPKEYKNTTGKGLWSGSVGIFKKILNSWQDQHKFCSAL